MTFVTLIGGGVVVSPVTFQNWLFGAQKFGPLQKRFGDFWGVVIFFTFFHQSSLIFGPNLDPENGVAWSPGGGIFQLSGGTKITPSDPLYKKWDQNLPFWLEAFSWLGWYCRTSASTQDKLNHDKPGHKIHEKHAIPSLYLAIISFLGVRRP